MGKNNYISYSLWGNKEIFTIGAIRNAELAKKIYKDWQVIIYYDNTVPQNVIDKLLSLDVQLVDMTNSGIYGLFWRFLAIDIPDSEFIIFRDADSRLSKREKLAVDEWMKSDKVLHVMRDHPCHGIPFGATHISILGGMWGIKGGIIRITPEIESFISEKEDHYGIDQTFLMSVYKKFEHSKTVHDEFFDKKPFPIKRKKFHFVGERIDENEMPLGDDWMHIKIYYKENYPSLSRRFKRVLKNLFK